MCSFLTQTPLELKAKPISLPLRALLLIIDSAVLVAVLTYCTLPWLDLAGLQLQTMSVCFGHHTD